MPQYDYDFFVIGAGSGGVRASRMAASYGAKVAVAEERYLGGTCVNVGCIPKKLLVYGAHFSEDFVDAKNYGWTVPEPSFDWRTLIANKDKEIARLNGIYRNLLTNAGVTLIEARARITGPNEVEVGGKKITAKHILVAVGAWPMVPDIPGKELGITSNEAFYLDKLPERVLIEGGGYIAVEFANIFHGLGVETTLVYRGSEILGRFDMDLRRTLHETMEKKGIRILCHSVLEWVRRRPEGGLDALVSGGEILTADQVMLAIGRTPNTEGLGLDAAGVELDKIGAVVVDDYSRTNVDNIWAVGDVTNRVQLTPVAIHEAMCFVETAFKDNPTKPDHDTIPTAVFSQPEIGTVGLSEDEASKRFAELEVYRALFRPMRHTLSGRDEKMLMKLVVDGASRKVIGAHVLGPDAGEMAQLLGIPIKAGLTKDDFDRTMAVHPTASEELVTMYKPSYRVKDGARID
jgi:glutathione reductase (NADPH)